MSRLSKRGEQVRQFILSNVADHPNDIVALVSQEFGVSRQAINRHLQKLTKQKAIVAEGSTRNRSYSLGPLAKWHKLYELSDGLEEDVVWTSDIKPLVSEFPDNVRDIWSYGITEMLNNAIDHSGGAKVLIEVEKTAAFTRALVYDDGEGIFKKIKRELYLNDERHSVLELAKGKLTTDPTRHTGEGIFFASRMFDAFAIISGDVFFSHQFDKVEDWIGQIPYESLGVEKNGKGTLVSMQLDNNTSRSQKRIFDNFSSEEDYSFSKTVVPVRLAQYGDEKLISRSQAKRLLSGIDKFKIVVFDFFDVNSIGQAFADEVFRVFKNQNPDIEVFSINASQDVEKMIDRAESH